MHENSKQMTHLSLFTGIGGLDIAAEMAGFATVGQCEYAEYPTKILEKHWPNVPRWKDIRSLTGSDFYEKTGLRTVDIISGGFPCQPFSVAGKRKGEKDDRYLWPEMLRVIQEIRPTWVIGENVPGIINMALDTVLSDLENQGYACQTFTVPAAGVDAPHRRDRVCIVGWNHDSQSDRGKSCSKDTGKKERKNTITGRNSIFADTMCHRSKTKYADTSTGKTWEAAKSDNNCEIMGNNDGCGFTRQQRREPEEKPKNRNWWPAEPRVGRVAYGIPKRVDRLKCLGNAVVPWQFYPFFKAIAVLLGGRAHV